MTKHALPFADGAQTIIDVLRRRAARQADRPAYTFLHDGEAGESRLTYGGLDRRARSIAARLQAEGAGGRQALLLYQPGLECVCAFYGCLYAGAIPVLAPPPRPNRPAPGLQAILRDARAAFVLTAAQVRPDLESRLAASPADVDLNWLATEEISEDLEAEWREPSVGGDSLAFLQYTSGSTSAPKGVMVTHGNLLHNLAMIAGGFRNSSEDVGVFWLPFYHDMGLVGGILEPAYVGSHAVLMSPASFLQRPARWLQALTRYGGTVSGGPNFAFQLCADKVTEEQRAGLDLSRWRLAFCGAEPIHPQTLERFAQVFEPCGFRREAFYPCYGMAEATLLVSGGEGPAAPSTHIVSRRELEHNRVADAPPDEEEALVLVGCGRALSGQRVVIADPETLRECPRGTVGEIWVSGPSVARGYWGRPDETAETFGARLADTGEGPFLRTGDLGYLRGGELFVTGRLKDLIVVRGHNYYPQDIERTAEQSHPALRRGGAAAFSVVPPSGTEERLVLVQEVERHRRNLDAGEVIKAVRAEVARHHGLQVHAVALVKPLSLPKTTSGKTRRQECRARFLSGGLETLAEWRLDEPAPARPTGTADASHDGRDEGAGRRRSTDSIREWLVSRLSVLTRVEPLDIDVREPFVNYGLDSVQAVSVAGDLERWLGQSLSPTLLYEYPTVDALARHLARDSGVGAQGTEADAAREASEEPVAIIGIGCRFPGADGPEAFWRLLREGVDAISEVRADRWNGGALSKKVRARRGGFLEGVADFDPDFFNISRREAAFIDPQQRILLEVAWEALEDAGLAAEKLAGSSAGVFVGISTNDYGRARGEDPELVDAYAATGNAFSIAANRVSYAFDLRGPSMAVDTACSSSLVAVHLACRSLHSGECSVALAGGVNLMLSPAVTLNFEQAGLMAADGRCKTFDARADGYVRGEGAGVVVLKPLSRALADGDAVYAVIRGTAVNQDGRTNGLMAPNPRAQEAVIAEAYRRARIPPGRAQYVEAHGTGTFLGDPIEINALGHALAAGREDGSKCAVGSLKTNVGHLEAAAGVAGLIKVALMLKEREMPPTLHFERPNPHIPFERLPLRVQDSLCDWPGEGDEAIAGVSSFGFGGTNAHAVLSSAPTPSERPRGHEAGAAASPVHILPLSARSLPALKAAARRLRGFVESGAGAGADLLSDICHTAGARRTHHGLRRSFVFKNSEELIEQLATFDGEADESAQGRASLRRPKCAFIFSGQGPQWQGMGRELLRREPVFREALSECDRLLRRHAGWSLLEELEKEEAESRLNETEFAQPVLFALQAGLAALWRHWGIFPDAVVGHSAGEVAAAYVAGALSMEEAVRLTYHRGRLMQRATGRGRMAAVALSAEEAQEALAGYAGRLSVACVNGPSSVVLSGDSDALEEIAEALRRREVACRVLPVNYAFHSFQMEPVQGELMSALHGLEVQSPALPFYSTASGEASNGHPLDADYWREQMRRPVLFGRAVGALIDEGFELFLEVGPHPVLSAAVGECLLQRGREGRVFASLRRGEGERASMLKTLGALYELGHAVEWGRLYGPGARPVRLPSYPWQRERCWLDVAPEVSGRDAEYAGADGQPAHPLLGRRLELSYPAELYVWEKRLDRRLLLYLKDHRFQNVEVLPGTAYVEMALAAAAEVFGEAPHALADVKFRSPLFLPDEVSCTLQLILSRTDDAEASFRVFARVEGGGRTAAERTLHAEGLIRLALHEGERAPRARVEPGEVRERAFEEVEGEDYYGQLLIRGFQYGPAFRGIKRLWRGAGEALGRVEVTPEIVAELDEYRLHPAVLDACAQVLMATDADGVRPFIPLGVDEIRVSRRPGKSFLSHARARAAEGHGASTFAGDVQLLDEAGEVLVEAVGLRVQYLEADAGSFRPVNPRDWLYHIRWEPKELPTVPSAGAGPEASRETWLLFKDLGGVGESLSARLAASGRRCVEITPGDSFERLAENSYRINPAAREDVRRLFAEAVEGDELSSARVVYLWPLDAPATEGLTASSLERVCLQSCAAAVQIVQALAAEAPRQSRRRLWVVTRGAQALAGEAVRPSIVQSPLWGLGRTVAQEHPSIWGGLIDLESGPQEGDDGRLVFEELNGGDVEDQIAYRGGKRYVARLGRWRGGDERHAAPRLRADGSYLITGGLGGIGLVVARWLVEQGARRLILVGRSQLPARSEWCRVDKQSRLAGQIAAVRELESLGASVHLASVDVADEERLAAFLEAFRREGWPTLRGVVHAAGVLQDQILAQLDEATMAAVFRAKVVGGWLLHGLTEQDPLDFFVLFSSAASMLGSGGQASYAAANAFLDGLAHQRRAQGSPSLSINWGPWAEVGMAAPAGQAARLASQGVGTIQPEQARDVFNRLLRQGASQVGVVPLDWEQVFRQRPELGAAPLLTELRRETERAAQGADADGGASLRKAILAAAESERKALLEAYLSEQVARVVRLPASKLNVSEPMNTLGIDSLMSIELKNRVEHELGVTVPVVKLLEGPTVREFAGMLLEQFGGNGSAAPSASDGNSARPAAAPLAQLVPVQPSGSRPPFFCVHPGALDVQCYSDLARHLGRDRPFYALQPANLDNYLESGAGNAAGSTIEQVAEGCVKALLAAAPRGPYFLGGWSLGGVLAFEIAQQLQRQGETVALLALFDSPAPPSGAPPAAYDDARLVPVFASYLAARRGTRLSLTADDLREPGFEERLKRLWERARARDVIAPETDPAQLRKLFEIYKNGLGHATRQLWNYEPRTYTGRLSIFRAADAFEEFARVFPDPASHWSKLASRPLDIQDVPGDHYSLFLEPHVQHLAQRLASLLTAAEKS